MFSDTQLWKFVDGELPAADAETIRAAAEQDAGLARRLDEMRTMKRAVLEGAPEPPDGFAARVAARAKLQAPPDADARYDDVRRFLRRALVAAALLGAAGLAYLFLEVVPDLVGPPALHAEDPFLGR